MTTTTQSTPTAPGSAPGSAATRRKSIDDIDVKSKRVLMRVDFNVPIENGRITDDRRIEQALPSVRSVLERGGAVILMSHLGRPEGTGYEAQHSLALVADRLSELLKGLPGTQVTLGPRDPASEESATAARELKPGEVLLLENLRFHKGEKKGDQSFARQLASYGDIYCNDAFGAAHRPDASMLAVPNAMNGKPKVAGRLLLKELQFLSETIENAERPFIAVLGGAKVSDKLGAIRNLIEKVDAIIIGGAMAYTFLKANGTGVGDSRVEEEMLSEAKELLALAKKRDVTIELPTDHICGEQFRADTQTRTIAGDIPEGWMGLDIGPETQQRYADALRRAKTIVWNGPMGVFEMNKFAGGTRAVAEAIMRATRSGAVSVVGGGDSAAAIEKFGLEQGFSHISTGGGASLQMLEGKPFETVAALDAA